MLDRLRRFAGLLLVVLCGVPVHAQTAVTQPASPTPAAEPRVAWLARNATRVETWRFFQPPADGGVPDYTTFANRLLAAVRHTGQRHEAIGAVQYVHLGNLPERATGPGALGAGATYFEHARERARGAVYVTLANLQLKRLVPGLDLRGGRMGYTSGAEMSSGDASVEAVKRLRLDSRLIGEFEWSMFGRSFDGVRLDIAPAHAVHATVAALWPTQGGFEPDANRSLRSVRVLAATAGLPPIRPAVRPELQAFVYHYRDTRPITARPDNSGRSAARVDISIATIGGSAIETYSTRDGRIDVLAWGALQTGDWYSEAHRAWAFAIEGGHQWSAASGRPWLRAGWNRASGDRDGSDAAHGTFFPMLPTGRKYSLSATYAMMNLDDRFAQLIVRPHAAVSVRADVHRLRLAEAADRWYAGSGATRRTGTIFGYAGRMSGGRTSLGTVLEAAADWTVSRHWSVNAYAGRILGGDVVRAGFAGDRLTFVYLESVIGF